MKKLFWLGLIGLLLFEVANVYFIMPMPGSQQMNSIDLAYLLFTKRWLIRGVFLLMILIGAFNARWKRKWLLLIPVVIVCFIAYVANSVMAADHMFYQPKRVLMARADENKVDSGRLVIGVTMNNEARAYPIRFLGYHHQVQDSIAGQPIMVTYCTVCRTGRVFQPIVDGKYERFRLVGMDHFNAMFEDATTGSWWRQVTGEAITGKMKGKKLPELYCTQTSLAEWMQLHPNSLVMQADSAFIKSYDTTGNYEAGRSKNSLTGTDSLSWNKKSWVIGVKAGKNSKAFDWNQLKQAHVINDKIGDTPVAVVLGHDDKSFFAFERPSAESELTLINDTLAMTGHRYRIDGKGIDTTFALKGLPASQEFWHSWSTFQPNTTR